MTSQQTSAASAIEIPEAARVAGGSKVRRNVLIAAGVSVAVVAGAAALSRGVRSRGGPDIRVFEVRKMNFPVVLKEKGDVKAKNSVEVKCKVSGQSRIIWLIPEGTTVKKGDLLAELASEDIDEKIRNQEISVAALRADLEAAKQEYEIQLDKNASDIRKAELKVRLAELELEKYVEGDYLKQLTEAQLAIDQANRTWERKIQDLEDSKKLYEQGYITPAELADDEFEKYKAEVELKKAKLAKEILEKYTYPATLEQKRSDVTEAIKELERTRKEAEAQAARKKANVESKQAQLEIRIRRLEELKQEKRDCKIYAPAPGMVVYAFTNWWRGDRIEEGAEVRKRQTIIELPDMSAMQVKLKIHESQTDKIKLGQRAVVTVEGIPDTTFTGTVTKIAPLAESSHRWLNPDMKIYTTEITLDSSDPRMKPGATAEVEIVVAFLEDVLAVPVQAVYGFAGEQYVFVKDGRDVRPAKVKLGISSNEYARVLEGLREGQKVMLTITEEMKQMLVERSDSKNNTQEDLRVDEDILRSLATSQPARLPVAATQPIATQPVDSGLSGGAATQPTPESSTTKPVQEPNANAQIRANSSASRSERQKHARTTRAQSRGQTATADRNPR